MNFALIGTFGLQMTVTFAAALSLWTVQVMASKTDTVAWYRANALRIAFAVAAFWLLAIAMVIVPSVSDMLGALGFNADKSTAGIALMITGYVIKKGASPPMPEKISDTTTGAAPTE